MNLYRIVSLESFIDLLHNGCERYVRPSKWDDCFEGYLFSKLYDDSEKRNIIERIYYDVCPQNYYETINNILKLEHAQWFVYGQCWSTLAESDAMWRIYSYGKHSIQIQTTEERISNLLKKEDGIRYVIKEVKYDVNVSKELLREQIVQLKEAKSIYEPFLHKRKAFEHEAEKRVLIDDLSWQSITSLSSIGANFDIENSVKNINEEQVLDEIERRLNQYLGVWKSESIPEDYYIKVPRLKDYIESVKVNPFAEDWYVQLISKLCAEYELQFVGKSGLYDEK